MRSRSIGKELGQLKLVTNFKAISAIVTVALLIFIVVGVMAGYVLYAFYIAPGPPPEEEAFYGTISITVNADDYLDRGATTTLTGGKFIAFHSYGKSISEAEESDLVGGYSFSQGTAKDVGVETEDNGHIWLYIYGGTSYYLHLQGTIDANPRLSDDYEFIDVDNDNRLEVLFDLDLSDIAEPLPKEKPTLDIVIMADQEDTTVSLNSPANQTSIATGTQVGTIEWQLLDIASKYGCGLARLYISQNRTQEDMMSITDVDIDQIGTFSSGDITYDSGAKSWYVDIGIADYKELVYAPILEHAQGGKSYVGITVSFETYFTASTDAVKVTLSVETIGTNEAVDTAVTSWLELGCA